MVFLDQESLRHTLWGGMDPFYDRETEQTQECLANKH